MPKVLDIVKYPDKRLTNRAKPVTKITTAVRELVADMFATMYANGGIGLAANQVGSDLYLFVMNTSKSKETERVFLNPIILAFHPVENDQYQDCTQELEEGCLSLPGVYCKIEAHEKIVLLYDDLYTTYKSEPFSGLEARVIQHECQHLQGRLITDQLSNLKRNYVLKKYKKNTIKHNI